MIKKSTKPARSVSDQRALGSLDREQLARIVGGVLADPDRGFVAGQTLVP